MILYVQYHDEREKKIKQFDRREFRNIKKVMYDIQAERSSEKLHRQGFRPPGLLTLCASTAYAGEAREILVKGVFPSLNSTCT